MSSKTCIRIGLVVVSSAMASGCNTYNSVSQSRDPGFGEALKYDMAIQTIDPAPVYGPEDAKPGDHGEKGAAAVDRYRKGSVKDVEQIETGGVSGGGGGGGGGSN